MRRSGRFAFARGAHASGRPGRRRISRQDDVAELSYAGDDSGKQLLIQPRRSHVPSLSWKRAGILLRYRREVRQSEAESAVKMRA